MNWTIAQLERNTSDDGVVIAHWRVSKTDGANTVSSYGTEGFTPDASAAGFVPFADLTEADVISWVTTALDTTAIEANLDAQLVELATPTTAAGLPW